MDSHRPQLQPIGDASNLPPLPKLLLWLDPIPRTGDHCMAADETLLMHAAEQLDMSVLRIYAWADPTVTYGFFDTEAQARALYDDTGNDPIKYVRRWTGGGIVDHRQDIPFTLVLIKQDCINRPSSAALYRWIHGGLARTLRDCGVDCNMLTTDAPDAGRACFSSPVTSDLALPNGDKLAGGGQRRTKAGVLHQGSIQNCTLPHHWATNLANRLAEQVITSAATEPFPGFADMMHSLATTKYTHPDQLNKR